MLKNRVKELRARFNINQQDLAMRIGVSRQTVSSIERGNYNPSIQVVLLMAEVFGVKVEEIFYLENEDEN